MHLPKTGNDLFRATRDDLIPLFLRSVSNQLLFAVIEMEDRVDAQRLRAALARITARFPLLSRSLKDEQSWPVWRAANRERGVKLRTIQQARTTSPRLLIREFRPEKLSTAAELWLFRHEDNDTLCLVADHTLTDAAGLKQLCYLVADVYSRGRRSNIAKRMDSVARRDQRLIYHQFGLTERLLRLVAWRPATNSWLFPPGSVNSRPKSQLRIHQLTASTMENMQQLRRAANATINDQLVAAYFVALKSHLHYRSQARLPIQITVDLRRYVPPGVRPRIANFSSSVAVCLPSDVDGDFAEVLCATSREINRLKGRILGLDASLAAYVMFSCGYRFARAVLERLINQSSKTGLATPILSNFGNIDESLLCFAGTAIRDAYLIGPSLTVPGLMLCVSGYRGKLTLSASYNESAVPDWLIRNIVASMDRTLGGARDVTRPSACQVMRRFEVAG